MDEHFDRSTEDVGNIVALEHVNTRIPDQRLATIFYVMGLGFTRDPYLMPGVDNMWINVGRSQFHLPTGEPQVLRGHVGLVLPDRRALLDRLTQVKDELDGTRFAFSEHLSSVHVTSPWGNRLRCFEPDPGFGRINLGLPYIEFDVPLGTAPAIAHFYREILGARTSTGEDQHGSFASCWAGRHQELIFREIDSQLPDYDGHHVQVYLADFSSPHENLEARDLITEESTQYQFRFKDIIDPDTGSVIFTVEHELRSMTHPLYARPLINRNPSLSLEDFAAGHEEQLWMLPPRKQPGTL